MAILAGAVMTTFDPSLQEQLLGTAQVVVADIDYARNLAVTNNSRYKLTFEPSQNRYYLEHSGTNPSLDALPASAFRLASDPATRQTTDLAALPTGTADLELLLAVQQDEAGTLLKEVNDAEFTPLGGTSRTQPTVIWLAAGVGDARRYISIRIDAVTGLASIGPLATLAPALPKSFVAPSTTSPSDAAPTDPTAAPLGSNPPATGLPSY